jgi:hypothetical protein
MIVNLTPHTIDVYPPDTPGIVESGRHEPVLCIEPSGIVARLVEQVLDGPPRPRPGVETVPVVFVEYGHVIDLPPARPAVWYVVSLPLALAMPARRDLLVSYRQVRNAAGTVVGCRGLAAPR